MNKVYSLDVPPAYPRGASSAYSSFESDSVVTVNRVLRAVRRRLSLLVAVFLLTFAAVAVFTFQLTPRYTATSSVIVGTPKQKVIDIGAVLQGLPADTATVDTEAEVLRSRSLIAKVVNRLDLIHNAEFNPAVAEPSPMQKQIKDIKGFIKSLVGIHKTEAKPVSGAAAEKATLDYVINTVLSRISINRHGPTYVIEISATSENPQMAADLANTIADVYLNNQLDTKFQATRRAQEWLDSRVSELREEVSNAESKVEARRAQLGALAAGGTTLLEQAVRDLNAQLSVAQGDYSTERAKLDNLNTQLREGKSIDAIPEALASANILELRKQAADIARRKADLQAKYFDTHPDVVRHQERGR